MAVKITVKINQLPKDVWLDSPSGKFFVYPRSGRFNLVRHNAETNTITRPIIVDGNSKIVVFD